MLDLSRQVLLRYQGERHSYSGRVLKFSARKGDGQSCALTLRTVLLADLCAYDELITKHIWLRFPPDYEPCFDVGDIISFTAEVVPYIKKTVVDQARDRDRLHYYDLKLPLIYYTLGRFEDICQIY